MQFADTADQMLMGGRESPKGTVKDVAKPRSHKLEVIKRLKVWRCVAIVAIVTAVTLLGWIVILYAYAGTESVSTGSSNCSSAAACVGDMRPKNSIIKQNLIFSGLTFDETHQVIVYLMKQSNLSLVPAVNATLNSNYIYSVEDVLPSKQDVLNYLDEASLTQPTRKARVLLFMGKSSPKAVVELIVHPIPNPQFQEEVLPKRMWKSRPICNTVEAKSVFVFLATSLQPIVPMFNASFGHWIGQNCSKKCLFFNVAPRVLQGSNDRHLITWFYINPESNADYYLYPLSLYILITTPGNGDQWTIKEIVHSGNRFSSIDAFTSTYRTRPNFRSKLPTEELLQKNRYKYGFPGHEYRHETPGARRRPPQQFMPDGNRFSVNGMHVNYLDWSFDLHPHTLTAVQLFNIKYGGERIAYEISMQDILVLYAGAHPDSYFKNYFDNGWATGRLSTPLMRNVDCPPGAVYLNSVVYGIGTDSAVTIKDAICIFEHRNSVPLRHHYSLDFFTGAYRFSFSMPDSVLIVRQCVSVWNYDYIYDYEFHQNGLIEAKVSSTGYIAVTPNVRDQKRGYLLNPDWGATGNLHQHLFNFKFDLDINGTKNRFKTVNIGYEKMHNPFNATQDWYQMKMEETVIENESEARFMYNFSEPKHFLINNYESKVNGLERGYKLQTSSFSKVVLPDDHPFMLAGASWARHQVAVTKHSEAERTTVSHFVQGDPFEPPVVFETFSANNDRLIDTDIVAWVTVGLHHIPTLEDLPVTTTPGKTLSIVLAPYNFFERDPSIRSRDATLHWNSELFSHHDEVLSFNFTCIPGVN